MTENITFESCIRIDHSLETSFIVNSYRVNETRQNKNKTIRI
jgi:hypothetical protein